jgi:hypothetical protein
MVDIDTFLTILYVMIDDFCKSQLSLETRPGPRAVPSRSEVIALAVFGQWYRFRTQRDFYRFAEQRLRAAFPTLPRRTQYNRLLRRPQDAIVAFFLHLVALRRQAEPAIPSVGRPALGHYVADAGFAGAKTHQRWRLLYQGDVISPPQTNSPVVWSKELRRWLQSHRQIIETVYEKLIDFFKLDKERPHDITGFQADLAAKAASHNFCIWLNKQLGRNCLAFADLLRW